MKNITGKILSIVFLFHLLAIQGFNLAEAKHQPKPVPTNNSQKNFTALEDLGATISILCETEEDDDEKFLNKIALVKVVSQPIKFFTDLVGFSFPPLNSSHVSVLSEQGISLSKIHCCFLI